MTGDRLKGLITMDELGFVDRQGREIISAWKEERARAASIIKDLMEFIVHTPFDLSNGVSAPGTDEGWVVGSKYLNEVEKRAREVLLLSYSKEEVDKTLGIRSDLLAEKDSKQD